MSLVSLLIVLLEQSMYLLRSRPLDLAGVAVWLLAAHQQWPLAARGLYGIALGYGAVLVYHLLLCWRIV
jgi:hypothetical protein